MRPLSSVSCKSARLLAISIPLMFGVLLGGFLIFVALQASAKEPGPGLVLAGFAAFTLAMGSLFAYQRRIRENLSEVVDGGEVLHVAEAHGRFDLHLSDIAAIRVRDVFPLELITLESVSGEMATFAVLHRNAITRKPSPVVGMLRRRAPAAFGHAAGEGLLSGPLEELPGWARCPEMLMALPIPLMGVFITVVAYVAGWSGKVDPPPPLWFGPLLIASTMAVGVLFFLMIRATRQPTEVRLRKGVIVVRRSLRGRTGEKSYPLSSIAHVQHRSFRTVTVFFVGLRGKVLPRSGRIIFATSRPQAVIERLQQAREAALDAGR